ncbi:YhcN/YlaJ family sporulation lipoprotein [Thalassobacillus pellis]|uniref:YhcN/YlaJ family sporulation lipoprotein n=1 Tax=Thalassobacillus pellis TaxID=748008 RepID=UPI0019611362|nr:YhcN/YlaJ family sporulation lipoprotein [Thalassobacillus pellis]MBM7552900.1 YhcN/YlaJ family sporulation lipoprotein [Thalassobacillus pellis]
MRKWMILATFVLPLILISACQGNEPETLRQDREGSGPLLVKDSDPVERKRLTNQEEAEHLSRLATEVPNVKDATAIVFGPYVIIGIDVDKDLDRSRVGTIKYSVAETMKHDPYGKQALVVADADGTERIRQLSQKIQQGHPLQAITSELSAIVGRYMPEMPIDEEQPAEPDQNKKTIPENERKQLEDIENDQSNDHLKQKNNS